MYHSKRFYKLFWCVLSFVILTILFRCLYIWFPFELFLSLYVTFLTTSYHFIMRIIVGESVTFFYRKREFHYECWWYQQHKFEQHFYKILKVKKWKKRAITAKPEQFDVKNRSFDELIHNMTQAEVSHEMIMVLSFVPLFFIHWYGAPAVFILTSIAACLVDFIFVMIQRYNRPRVLQMKKRRSKIN